MNRFLRWLTNADARDTIAAISESLSPGGQVYESILALQKLNKSYETALRRIADEGDDLSSCIATGALSEKPDA